MQNSISILALPVIATGAITNSRFVTPAGAQAGAGVNTYGVARTDANVGDRVTVTVLGTEVVETGAAIAAGALVETDASGRAITHASGVVVARLAPGESASAAGQKIEVILLPN